MGVSTTTYTVYAVKIDWNDEFSEDYYEEDNFENTKDSPLNVIFDGMGGEYIMIGKILFDSGDDRWGEVEDTYVEIDLDSLPEIEQKVRTEFAKVLPKFNHLIEGKKFKLITFTHYS